MSDWTYISELSAGEIYQKLEAKAKQAAEQAAEQAKYTAEQATQQAKQAAEQAKQFSPSQNETIAAAAATILPALKDALEGAGGSAVSNIVTYPLDLVVTRLQVQAKSDKASSNQYDGIADAVQKIYGNEGGLAGFYAGVMEDTFKDVVDSFIFFLAYNIVWKVRRGLGALATNPMLQVAEGLGVGVVAGALTKAITMPMQNIVTYKQTESPGQSRSVGQIIADIRREKGVAGFWSGYSATLVLTLNPSVTFFLDAFWRKVLRTPERPGSLTTFLLAANGKSTATILMYPFKLARSRAQTSKKRASSEGSEEGEVPENVFEAIAHIAEREGWTSLYSGLGGDVMKGFFQHGLTMVFKERMQSVAIQLFYVINLLLNRQSRMKI